MTNTTSELEALLIERSLADPELHAKAAAAADFRILPDATVIKIGGQSVIDRSRAAARGRDRRGPQAHKLLIGTGAGTRARRTPPNVANLLAALPTSSSAFCEIAR